MAWVLDLDGVVWRGDEPIAGAAEAVARIKASGRGVVFLTNNSSQRVGVYEAKLARFGIPVDPGDVMTSAQVAATLLAAGETALVCGGEGIVEALEARGVRTIRTPDEGRADAVVVGWHRDFDYGRLDAAFQAVTAGARLIGTNDDATYPTPEGFLPGGGSILAAVAYATGVTPVVAGKPHQPTVDAIRAHVAARVPGDTIEAMVGDRPDTDGELARRLGATNVLVLSGVTPPEDGAHHGADVVALDLLAAVERLIG